MNYKDLFLFIIFIFSFHSYYKTFFIFESYFFTIINKTKVSLEKRKVTSEVPKLIDYLKSYLEAGLQPTQALAQIASQKKWCFPIQSACEEIVSLYYQGMSFRASLNQVIRTAGQDFKSRYFCFFLSSLRLGYLSGGNISSILERVKEKTESSIQIERKIKVSTAQMRLQALVISLAPLFLACILWFISREYILFFFRGFVGNILLVIMVLFNFLAFYFLRSFVKISYNKDILLLYMVSDFIDHILLYLEAGHNIYFAFKQATYNIHNVFLREKCNVVILNYSLGASLVDSFKKSIQEDRKGAYQQMVENILLSLQLGTPLVKNLAHLSLHMKANANSELEETAAKAPIKMIFPLVFFIFPVIFILLGAGSFGSFIP